MLPITNYSKLEYVRTGTVEQVYRGSGLGSLPRDRSSRKPSKPMNLPAKSKKAETVTPFNLVIYYYRNNRSSRSITCHRGKYRLGRKIQSNALRCPPVRPRTDLFCVVLILCSMEHRFSGLGKGAQHGRQFRVFRVRVRAAVVEMLRATSYGCSSLGNVIVVGVGPLDPWSTWK